MKNMKKLWAALLALAMTFSLAACGGTSDEESTETLIVTWLMSRTKAPWW